MERTARFITSGRRGVSKIDGSSVFPIGFPLRSKIWAVFLVGIVFTVISLEAILVKYMLLMEVLRRLFLVVVLGAA